MAEIKVEKKKPIWPWIVGILAAILIIFLLFMFLDDEGTDDDIEERDEQVEERIDPYETEDDRDMAYPESAVGSYLYYIDEEYPQRQDEDTEEYSEEAMQKLAAAVEEKSMELQEEPDTELAELAEDSADTTAATGGTLSIDEIQREGEIIVNALADLQQNHYEELEDEIAELRSDLDEINQTTEGDEQAEAVDEFFQQAAEVLREMPQRAGGATMERSQPADTEGFSTDVDTIETDDN